MEEREPYSNDARRAKRERDFGPEACCPFCGCTDYAAFVEVEERLFEEHHLLGHANDPELTDSLDRNCHAGLHEGFRDAGVSLREPDTPLHRVRNILHALSVHFQKLADRCTEWAKLVQTVIDWLDENCPGWREGVPKWDP